MKYLKNETHTLSESDINEIVSNTDGYSITDLKNLSQEAAMGPIKSHSSSEFFQLNMNEVSCVYFSLVFWTNETCMNFNFCHRINFDHRIQPEVFLSLAHSFPKSFILNTNYCLL